MTKTIRKSLLLLALSASFLAMSATAMAQEWPLVSGDYWSVTGIEVKDGGDLKYQTWLANEWKSNAEFAKSKGWLKDYMIFSNVHPRKGEPDLYLVWIFENMPSGPESEARYKEYMNWQTKTEEQMEAESGNRAEYREVLSTSLLQVLNFRK